MRTASWLGIFLACWPLSAAGQANNPDEEDQELDRLRQAALSAAEAAGPTQAPAPEATREFTSGERAQQALNPEISVVGDAGGRLFSKDYDGQSLKYDSGFFFRVLGLHFQSDLDPFSFFKAAVEMNAEHVGLGEAYATFTNVLPGLNLTVGKFRQQLGVVQRWHEHALDQFDFPLAVSGLLGPEGLCQIGLSLEWKAPALWADHQALALQVTNQMNEHLFSGQMFGPPAALLRWSQYFDLSSSTYLELGFSGMLGTNNRLNVTDEHGVGYDEPWRTTTVAASDLTISWAPRNRERYRHLTLRGEFYWVGKEMAGDYISAAGGFIYLDAGLSESLAVGARGDLAQPFVADNSGRLDWQAVAYLTWWQSEWVGARLQLAHLKREGAPAGVMAILQVMFAAGPHKHERY